MSWPVLSTQLLRSSIAFPSDYYTEPLRQHSHIRDPKLHPTPKHRIPEPHPSPTFLLGHALTTSSIVSLRMRKSRLDAAPLGKHRALSELEYPKTHTRPLVHPHPCSPTKWQSPESADIPPVLGDINYLETHITPYSGALRYGIVTRSC